LEALRQAAELGMHEEQHKPHRIHRVGYTLLVVLVELVWPMERPLGEQSRQEH